MSNVWHSLAPAQRAHGLIFAVDYGEAGAINEVGRGLGLPVAVSGHNSEWFWGPGNPGATTVVVVAPGPKDVTGYGAYLYGFFHHVVVAATLDNHAGLHNQEWGGHIYICTGPLEGPELYLKGYLGAGQSLANGTAVLGPSDYCGELLGRQTWHDARDNDVDASNAISRLQFDVGKSLEHVGGMPNPFE